jgi:uncharacterized protein (DUF488 family)
MTVFTLGHSNRTAEEFLSLLKEYEIETVADIRRFPSSRKNPQFGAEPLQHLLQENGVAYIWFESLGGRRKVPRRESPNLLLRSKGFRNYADYMMTEEFHAAAHALMSVISQRVTAILCAERLYWKCHRMLLSDYLTANGVEVIHILGHEQVRRHELMKGAVITSEKCVIYPAAATQEERQE